MWYFPNVLLRYVQYLPLFSGVNSYDWGKVGSESAAAKFATATPSDNFSIEQDKPYAEVRTSREYHSSTVLIRINSYGWERILRCLLKT